MFSYGLKKEDKEIERTGEVTIWIVEDMNEIEMIIEGDFNSSTFRDNALEVGDTHMKAYKMMGAVAGFGLDMEGGIELC